MTPQPRIGSGTKTVGQSQVTRQWLMHPQPQEQEQEAVMRTTRPEILDTGGQSRLFAVPPSER